MQRSATCCAAVVHCSNGGVHAAGHVFVFASAPRVSLNWKRASAPLITSANTTVHSDFFIILYPFPCIRSVVRAAGRSVCFASSAQAHTHEAEAEQRERAGFRDRRRLQRDARIDETSAANVLE